MAENVEFIVSAKDQASEVFATIEKGLKGIGGELLNVRSIVGAATGTLGVGLFVHMIDSTIRAQAELVHLGEIAGVSAAKMSALKGPADLAGMSLDNVAGIVAKLSKAVGEAQLGDPSKKTLFAALGIDPNDGRDAADRLLQVSKVLGNMTNENIAAKVSNDLLGKSFAEARPLMKELAELDQLKARTTNEAAAASKQFEDNVRRLTTEGGNLKKALANELLPSLNEVVSAMVRAQREGGALAMIVAGIQTAATGTDQYKNDKEIVELTQRKLEIQNKIDELRNMPPMATPGLKGDNGPSTIQYWEKELEKLNQQLKTATTYRQELESPGSIFGKATVAQGANDGMDNAAIAAIIAEDKLIKQMEFEKRYPVLVAQAEGFSKQYSAAIRTSDQLIQEAFKQGEMGEKEMIQAIEANNQARLTVEIQQLQALKALAKQKFDLAKEEQLAQQILEKKAEKEASSVIAHAKVNSIDGKSDAEWRKDLAQRLQRIQIQNQTQSEVLMQGYTERLNDIDLAEQAGLVSAQEAARQRELVEMQHQANLGNIVAQGQLQRRQIDQMSGRQQVEFYVGTLAQVTSEAARHNKAFFEINKAANIANAVMSTFTGATKALEWGFPLGPVFAGIIMAAGMVNIAAIRAQSFQGDSAGGGGGSAPPAIPTFSANPNTGAPIVPTASATTMGAADLAAMTSRAEKVAPTPTPAQISITLVGKTFDAEQVRDLIASIKEQATYGADITVQAS